MPLFRCSKCGCIENTALSYRWMGGWMGEESLCSECDPEIGKWHGEFPKKNAVGMMEDDNGFLYTKEELAPGGYFHGRVKAKEIKKDAKHGNKND